MDNVYTIVQGRLKEDKETYAFFLDVQKAYDTVLQGGMWLKLWDMGVKGKMWRVIAERISARQYKSGSILGIYVRMYVRSVICAGAYE